MKSESARVRAWSAAISGALLLGASLITAPGVANAEAPPWVINATVSPGQVGGSGTVTFSSETLYRATFSDPQCAPQQQAAPDGTLSIDFTDVTWINLVTRHSPPLSQWPSTTSTTTDPAITTCQTAAGADVAATATVTRTTATWSVDYSCQRAGNLIVPEYSNNPYLSTLNPGAIWGGTRIPLRVPDNGSLPASCPTIALSAASGVPGSPLTVTGTGYTPSGTVTLFFDRSTPVGSVAAGADGTYTANITVPAGAANGLKVVSASSAGAPDVGAQFTVTAPPTLAGRMDVKAAQWGLGASTSPVTDIRNGGSFRNYQYGAIIGAPSQNLFVSHGGIRGEWGALNFENGVMGYPTTDEVAIPAGNGALNAGVYQNYDGGAILWSAETGAHESLGIIRSEWRATGFERGPLGYPTTDVVTGLLGGGSYQNYQGGAIVSSPASGTHESIGAFRSKWRATGFEGGVLGYPTTEVVTGLVNGGAYQNYQGGAILTDPSGNPVETHGPIRAAWQSTGFENGRLGYPTSDVYSIPNGTSQNFQYGRITDINGAITICTNACWS